jgi:hypothetical protein
MRSTQGRLDTLRSGPDHLPLLERGAHRSPERGACLMEYVSVLAGTRFSDRPRCTHPALALLARWVNDEISDAAARARLAVLAPDLIGTRSTDPRITLAVAACCLRSALAASPQDQHVQSLLRRTEAQLARWEDPWARWWARWLGKAWERTAWSRLARLRVALLHMTGLRGPHHDDQLRELLEQAIVDCRGLLTPHRQPTAQPSVTRGRVSGP